MRRDAPIDTGAMGGKARQRQDPSGWAVSCVYAALVEPTHKEEGDMKAIFTRTILALLAVTVLASAAMAATAIGTVDVQRVRKENAEFKAAQKEIDDMVADFERQRDQKQAELQDLSQQMQDAQNQNVAASVDRLRRTLADKSQAYQTFMEESFGSEGIIENKSSELLEPIYTKLADAAKTVAKTRSLDLILDLEQINPLYSSDALDVTDDVLTELAKLR